MLALVRSAVVAFLPRPILIDGGGLFLDDLASGSLRLTVQQVPWADGIVVPIGCSETTTLLSEYQCHVEGKRSLLKNLISQGRKLMIATWIQISACLGNFDMKM